MGLGRIGGEIGRKGGVKRFKIPAGFEMWYFETANILTTGLADYNFIAGNGETALFEVEEDLNGGDVEIILNKPSFSSKREEQEELRIRYSFLNMVDYPNDTIDGAAVSGGDGTCAGGVTGFVQGLDVTAQNGFPSFVASAFIQTKRSSTVGGGFCSNFTKFSGYIKVPEGSILVNRIGSPYYLGSATGYKL